MLALQMVPHQFGENPAEKQQGEQIGNRSDYDRYTGQYPQLIDVSDAGENYAREKIEPLKIINGFFTKQTGDRSFVVDKESDLSCQAKR